MKKITSIIVFDMTTRNVVHRRGKKMVYRWYAPMPRTNPIIIKYHPPVSGIDALEAFNKAVESYQRIMNTDYELIDDPDESDEDKYAAIADAIEMNENMVKYGTIDKPKEEQLTQGQLDYIALIEWRPDLALWGGDPDCKHDSVPQRGGGCECKYCGAWFCF